MMNETRLVSKVYRSSKEQYNNNRTNNWCASIHRILLKYNLIELWNNENEIINPRIDSLRNSTKLQIRNYWNKYISNRIHQVEEEKWRREVEKKRKLRSYRTFKNNLSLEQYLVSEKNKNGRSLLTRVRSGTSELRI